MSALSFTKSLLIGSEGTYHLFGMEICFNNNRTKDFSNISNPILKATHTLTDEVASNIFFKLISQFSLHVFVHEMGHALAYKFFTGEASAITISSNEGLTQFKNANTNLDMWQDTAINLAGTASDLAFSSLKLLLLFAIKNYISFYLLATLSIGTSIIVLGEMVYSLTAALSANSGGDFEKIVKNGFFHFFIASLIILLELGLTVYANFLIFK